MYVVCSTWVPPLINLDSGGMITRKIIGKPKEGRNICNHLFLSSLEDYSITLIDKTDGSDPSKREEY